MPRKALDMKVSERQMAKFIEASRPTAKAIDALVKPRFAFLAERPWTFFVAILIVLAALVTFPLGLIPVAPLLPGVAIVLFGLGLTARDGLLLTLATLIVGGAFWLVFGRLF
jgi:hypothetical protein